MSLNDESLAWRRQVLEEATRLRAALKQAQEKRQQAREEERVHQQEQTKDSEEMQKFEEAEAKLKRNTTRLLELRKQVENAHLSSEAEAAHLEKLEMAQAEMERTAARLAELEKEDQDNEQDYPDETDESDTTDTQSETTTEDTSARKPVVPPLKHTESYMKRAEDTWKRIEEEVKTERLDVRRSSITEEEEQPKVDGFVKPRPKNDDPPSWETIRKDMHLSSSPLVFFNLACFQGSGEADLDVMHPICGYAVAGKILGVMGPPGTDTSTLRVALSDFGPRDPTTGAQRDVLVADFTVADLVDVADSILRPDTLRPSESLIKFLGLENVADVQIGTCIQRGGAGDSTMGTPRGARNPEAPTPRNPNTPRFRGTKASIQKAVLLMEDLMSILDPESIYRVLKALRKVSAAKRASVIVTVNKGGERRGLFKLFDDLLFFTEEGVSYFGPARRLPEYMKLINSPCPQGVHPTDHILQISNAAAKYDECPIKKTVDTVILEYTGAREQSDSPQAALEKASKNRPLIPGFKRKSKKNIKAESVPEAFENAGPGLSNRARRLAQKLAEERRELALKQRAEEKLAVWKKLAELDMHIARDGSSPGEPSARNFEQILLELQKDAKRQKPSCFMNLACFLNIENPDKETAAVIQPTCAFANEGTIMGIFGPEGSDADNLLSSLKHGEATTTVTDMSVRDTLKLSEFLKNREKDEAGSDLDSSVEILMAKMMLSASSQEIVGTLIQRGSANASQSSKIEIGDKMLSTSVRSILLLDRIHNLDAQSLFVVLKLIKRIASPARIAVIFMLRTEFEAEGLFPLLDTILLFNHEGVGFFGPAKHLNSYCTLVGFPKPDDKHVTAHFKSIMDDFGPSNYHPSPDNVDTPFTIRYQYSPLAKYNKGIIELSTKPVADGGAMSSRTLIPKSFRKKTTRSDVTDEIIEKAELARQRLYHQVLAKANEAEKQRERDLEIEKVWKKMAGSDASHRSGAPLARGLESIVAEMETGDQRPSLFFNLACFMPDVETDRIDMMQPICGYALIGRVVAIMGPPETDLSAFLAALGGKDPATDRNSADGAAPTPSSSMRSDVLYRQLSVIELLKIAENTRADRGSQPVHETAQTLMVNLGLQDFRDCQVGTYIQRGLSATELSEAQSSGKVLQLPSILMLDGFSEGLEPEALFVILKLVKRIATQAQMAVIVNLPKSTERRGLFTLFDDVLIFDHTGVAYFGPANRLRDYLALVAFSVPESMHETDFVFELLKEYSNDDPRRARTNTSPPVRYKYSVLNKHVNNIVEKYTRPATNEYDLQSSRNDSTNMEGTRRRGQTFIPKGTRNAFAKRLGKAKGEERRRLEEEEAALRRERIAEEEAECERQRVTEMEAESVWASLAEQDDV